MLYSDSSSVLQKLRCLSNLFDLQVPFRFVLGTSEPLPAAEQAESLLRKELASASIRVLDVACGSWIIHGVIGYLDGVRLVRRQAPLVLLGHSVVAFEIAVSRALPRAEVGSQLLEPPRLLGRSRPPCIFWMTRISSHATAPECQRAAGQTTRANV